MIPILFYALSTLILAVLASLNALQAQKDRSALSEADKRIQYFARMEVRRAWMRASGWALWFVAMVSRLLMAEGPGRTWTVTALILLGFGVFVTEALIGRRERKRMMRGR